jgi:NADH-ubiquinone oxidoreductase chain 5
MKNDPYLSRFLGYLSLFTFFMLLLVTADNFLVMFLGWEGIGLSSFLLISFWSNRIQAGKSAVKAMLVNRVGDIGLAIGICYVFLTFKTIDYCLVFSLISLVSEKYIQILGFSVSITTVITLLFL